MTHHLAGQGALVDVLGGRPVAALRSAVERGDPDQELVDGAALQWGGGISQVCRDESYRDGGGADR